MKILTLRAECKMKQIIFLQKKVLIFHKLMFYLDLYHPNSKMFMPFLFYIEYSLKLHSNMGLDRQCC